MDSSQKEARRGNLVRKVILAFTLWMLFGLAMRFVIGALAAEPANDHFQRTWDRTDDPVKLGHVNRTWMWGDGAFTDAMPEPYVESPGGERTVQYFDKTRMEINDPAGDPSTAWFVTNGLLVVELITGELQLGDATFEPRDPATGNVADDQDDPTGPTYQTMARLLGAAALPDGTSITWRLDRDGNVTDDPSLTVHGVTAAEHVQVPGIDHQVASPFWEFMNSAGHVNEHGTHTHARLFPNPFYATGLPITEAYWANVKVAGTYQDVLLQCFERRCLTYTPGNDPGWQVEAGNVGQHYYTWRYGQEPGDGPVSETPTAEPTLNPSPTAVTDSPTATPGSPDDPSSTPTEEPGGPPDPTDTAEPTEEPARNYVHSHQIGRSALEFDDFWLPEKLTTSPDGHLYVADSFDRIMKFTNDGQLVTAFVNPNFGYSNRDGSLATDTNGLLFHANIYRLDVFNPDGSHLRTWEVPDCAGGPARLDDIAVDSNGGVYVLSKSMNRLYKYSSSGRLLGQWGDPNCKASSIEGQFDSPEHVTTDSSGTVYVVDSGNNRIQTIDSTGSFVELWTRSDDLFANVAALAIDKDDVLYLAIDKATVCTDCIQTYRSDGTFLGTWSSGGSGAGQFQDVIDMAIDSDGYVYLTDVFANRILKLDSNANFADEWSDFRRGRFVLATFGMALDADNNLYVADDYFDRVQVFDSTGSYLHTFGEPGTGTGMLNGAADVATDGDFVYVLDATDNRVLKYRRDGSFVGERDGPFNHPHGIETDAQGTVYIADTKNHRIVRYDPNGSQLPVIGQSGSGNGQLASPYDLAIHGGRIYVADTMNHRIQVFNLQGDYLEQWGTEGTGSGQFQSPGDVAVDGDGYVYVADTLNHRIQKFTPEGDFLTTFGSEGSGPDDLASPWKISIASNGDVYVLDWQLTRVQVFRPVD